MVDAQVFPYLDPPAHEIPGVIAEPQVITEHDDAAISLDDIRVHSTGMLVTFAVRMPTAPTVGSDLEREWWWLLREQRDAPCSGILLGYRVTSGQWRSTIDGAPADLPRAQATAPISLQFGRNRGRDGTVTYWLWPLSEGDTTFFGRWESQRLAYGTVTVSAARVAMARPDPTA
jgi:hypothetical protein